MKTFTYQGHIHDIREQKESEEKKKGIADTSKLQCETTVSVNREDMVIMEPKKIWCRIKLRFHEISLKL